MINARINTIVFLIISPFGTSFLPEILPFFTISMVFLPVMVNSGGVKTEKILIIIVARLAKECIDLAAVLKRTRGTHD